MGDHYVYLYRDLRGRPRYVGYGKGSARASSHISGSHNRALYQFLRQREFTLEIAGPYESEDIGRAVETALISTLQPDLNVGAGETQWRFRPLGVPTSFAERLVLPPLYRKDFLKRTSVASRCPVVFVYINDRNFDDGRVGYSQADPPGDIEILNRIDRWWVLGKRPTEWQADPKRGAKLLLGISGRPRAQIVIGSILIATGDWANAARDRGYWAIPTAGPENLDAFGLRGRRLAPEAGIKFGSFTSQQFVILSNDGSVIGGHQSVRAEGWR